MFNAFMFGLKDSNDLNSNELEGHKHWKYYCKKAFERKRRKHQHWEKGKLWMFIKLKKLNNLIRPLIHSKISHWSILWFSDVQFFLQFNFIYSTFGVRNVVNNEVISVMLAKQIWWDRLGDLSFLEHFYFIFFMRHLESQVEKIGS